MKKNQNVSKKTEMKINKFTKRKKKILKLLKKLYLLMNIRMRKI